MSRFFLVWVCNMLEKKSMRLSSLLYEAGHYVQHLKKNRRWEVENIRESMKGKKLICAIWQTFMRAYSVMRIYNDWSSTHVTERSVSNEEFGCYLVDFMEHMTCGQVQLVILITTYWHVIWMSKNNFKKKTQFMDVSHLFWTHTTRGTVLKWQLGSIVIIMCFNLSRQLVTKNSTGLKL